LTQKKASKPRIRIEIEIDTKNIITYKQNKNVLIIS